MGHHRIQNVEQDIQLDRAEYGTRIGMDGVDENLPMEMTDHWFTF